MKNKLILGILLIITVTSLFFVGKNVLGGDLVIDMERHDINNTLIYVNDVPQGLNGYNETTKTVRYSNILGSKKITIKSAGMREFTHQQTFIIRGSTQLNPEISEISAEQTSKQLAETIWPNTTVSITNSRYTNNQTTKNKQLLFDAKVDGLETPVVAEFDYSSNSWKQVVSGD
ncbi:MAG: hypothetical protein M3Q36_02975 [bacterium]|nr:hypothetical protein [bacterium]